MADAYARQNNTAAEFALYDSMLAELAAKTSGQPLSAAAAAPRPPMRPATPDALVRVSESDSEEAHPGTQIRRLLTRLLRHLRPAQSGRARLLPDPRPLSRPASSPPATSPRPSPSCARQIDRDPDDPALYERLADFLSQNNLPGAEADTYKQALARFHDNSWFDKLARFYIRTKDSNAAAALTRQVTDIFSGTDLDAYFFRVEPATNGLVGPQLALQLNLYAAKRFPHDLVFIQQPPQRLPVPPHHQHRRLRSPAPPALVRLTRPAKPVLRLPEPHRQARRRTRPTHHDSGCPIHRVFCDEWVCRRTQPRRHPRTRRSLHLDLPVRIRHTPPRRGRRALPRRPRPRRPRRLALPLAQLSRPHQILALPRRRYRNQPPRRLTRLARPPRHPRRSLRRSHLHRRRRPRLRLALLASASPPSIPDTPAGYLTSATIFWDYFQFDRALAELTSARTRFHQPALYGYEAGAIQENRRDLAAAVAEYTASATQPPELTTEFNSFVALAQA